MKRLPNFWLKQASFEPAFIRSVCDYWGGTGRKEQSWLQLLKGTQTANNQRFRLTKAISILQHGGYIQELSSDRWEFIEDDNFSIFEIISGAMTAVIWSQLEKIKNKPRIIATLPEMGALSNALSKVGYMESKHDRTDAFIRGAMDKAEKRFIIMTPFIDEAGAKWALDTFGKANNHVNKIIISRFITCKNDMNVSSGLKLFSKEFSDLGVKLLELSIPSSETLFIETFHAKLLLIDEHTAYIGSSNFTETSMGKTLELGAALYGDDTKTIVELINAIMLVSTSVEWQNL